jgi:hypothetical protein
MIKELTKQEQIAINGGETTPESIGYEIGNWAGKCLIAFLTLKGLKKK